MIPSNVFRELAEDWLSSFEVREEGFRLLSAATEMPADSWRKRLSEATYTTRKGSVGAHGWYAKTTLTEEEVDEFLTAAGLTHLWHTDLSEYQPPATAEDEDFHSTCVDCGTWIDWSEAGAGVTVEIGQVVNVRRQYRWFSLCPVCTSTRFPLPEKRDATGRVTTKMPVEVMHAAYLEYVRKGTLAIRLGERLWQRYGYKSAQVCSNTLLRNWRDAGWPLRDRVGEKRKVNHRVSDATLRKAYELHMRRDMSLNEIGRRLYEKLGYKNAHSCAVSISAGWRRLGLKARDRIEMTQTVSTKNGLSPRDHRERRRRRLEAGLTAKGKQRQPKCIETVKNGDRKGERCGRPALHGKTFCASHDPAADDARRANLARMRRRSLKQNPDATVAVGVILPDLLAYHRRYRSWRVLAEFTGIAESMLYRHSKRPSEQRMTIQTFTRLREGLDRLMPVELAAAA